MSLNQIKSAFLEGKFLECIQLSDKLLQKEPQNKHAIQILAASQVELGRIPEAQNTLNVLYSLIAKPAMGTKSPDDQLYFQALQLQKKLAISMQTNCGGNKQLAQQGLSMQIENQFQILDFLDKKEQYPKMLKEIENYCLLCIQNNQQSLIEETYIWLFQHHALSPEVQLKYGCLVFYIDDYKPKSNLENLFPRLFALFKEVRALKLELTQDDTDNLVGLAKKLLDFIDRQSWKKEIYVALQSVNQNPNAVFEYKRYIDSLMIASEIYFEFKPMDIVQSETLMHNFARFLAAKSIALQLYSAEWDQFIQHLKLFANNEYFIHTQAMLDCNPVQLLVHAILDYNEVLQNGVIANDPNALYFNSRFLTRNDWINDLEFMSEKYGKMTPIVNIYYAMCWSKLPPDLQMKIDSNLVLQKLEQSDFLNSKIIFYKLVGKKQPSDCTALSLCLKIKVVQQLPESERENQNFKIQTSADKVLAHATPKIVKLYSSEISQIRWISLVSKGQWKEAIDELITLTENDISKQSWAQLNIAWIRYSFLKEVAGSNQEQKIILQSVYNKLSDIAEDDSNQIAAQAMLCKGFLIYHEAAQLDLHGEDANTKAPLALWLQALKKDQTKPEIFQSLAVFYFFIEDDKEKAKKCAEKALLLKPDFEQAFLLLFQLTADEKPSEALDLISKVQGVNKSLASTYYLKGIILQNQCDYIQAIDNLQNATKFYTIDHQSENKLCMKPLFPTLFDACKRKSKPIALFSQQLGIFGLHPNLCVSAWILLTDCFEKIEKPQVALKCFQKAMEEITLVVSKLVKNGDIQLAKAAQSDMDKFATTFLAYLDEAKSFTQVSFDKAQNESIEAALTTISSLLLVNPNASILLECLNCLLIGAKMIKSDEFSIKIARLAVQILSNVSNETLDVWNLMEEALKIILHRQASLMGSNQVLLYGQVQMTSEDHKQIESVLKISSLIEQEKVFKNSLNIQKALQNVLLTVSQKTGDVQQRKELLARIYRKSLLLKQLFVPEGRKDLGRATREIIVDAAKIAHQCEKHGVIIEGVQFDQEKLKLIRKAIMMEPLRAELWVLLHLFLADDSVVKTQAIFKAYELEPDSQFVQSYLIKHYMKSPKSYIKAFKVIVKSYQQAINQRTEQNPIVLATLALLNSKSCFLEKSLSSSEKRAHLLEAFSLIDQINHNDLIGMFSELRLFLLQEKGEFLEPIKYLTHVIEADPKQIHGMIRLLLLQAYMGSSVIKFSTVKEQYAQFAFENDLNEIEAQVRSQIDYIFEIENVPIEAIQVETEQTIQDFSSSGENAKLLATKLILLQEVCLQLNILPSINLLDANQDILRLLDTLELQQQRSILLQSLRFLKKRDGEILEQTAVREEGVNDKEQQLRESKLINYSRFLHQFSRISSPAFPQLSTAQNKALFRLFIEINERFEESQTLKMHNSQVIDVQDHKLKGLQIMITKLKQDIIYAQKDLMKNPTSLQANMTWVWSLFHRGKGAEAIKAFELLKNKLSNGIIAQEKLLVQELNKLESFVHLFTGKQSGHGQLTKLDLISVICKQVDATKTNPEQSDEIVNSLVDNVAISMIKILMSQEIQALPQLESDLFNLLSTFVFDQRQFLIFNKLTARLLQLAISLLSPQAFASQEIKSYSYKDKQMLVLINDIWIFKTLHNASALTELKKFAGVDSECNQAEKVLNLGIIKRNPLPAQLLKARAYILVKNYQQSGTILELTSDQATIERDFIVALANYAQQAYKQFYLNAMGLVAGCKTSMINVQLHDSIQTKRQAHFNLAYAYYLKAFAEATFHAARQQNLTLQEDFGGESDAILYNQAYFLKKVNSSLQKCEKELIKTGDTQGLLMRAVKEMQTEINQNN